MAKERLYKWCLIGLFVPTILAIVFSQIIGLNAIFISIPSIPCGITLIVLEITGYGLYNKKEDV